MANLTLQLFEALPIVLADVGAYLGVNSDPNRAYPLVSYSMISQSKATDNGLNSFDTSAEQFRVQVSIYDNDQELEGLLQTLASVTEAMKIENWSETGITPVQVKRIGGYGPTYIGNEKYWMMVTDFLVVLAKDRSEAETENS